MPSADLISVTLFGHPDPDIAAKLLVPGLLDVEADNFAVACYPDDRERQKHPGQHPAACDLQLRLN